MKRVEDHLSQIGYAISATEAYNSFIRIMGEYGYDKVAYGYATDHASIGLPRTHGHINNFPEEWMKHYLQKNYETIDPVANYMMKNARPAYWTQVVSNPEISEPSKKLMSEASEAGLKEGAIIPLHNPFGEIAAISVSSGITGNTQSPEMLRTISLLGIYFHETYKSLIKKRTITQLTDKEYDLLSWAANGKADDEIETMLGMSTATLRYYWTNIFNKMYVSDRMSAVAKAIQMRLVTPGRL
jgi:DNA-binding CsgD family transcriptional regulator